MGVRSMSDFYNDHDHENDGSSYISENSKPKKANKHRGLKAVAILLCVAILGATGWQVHKFMNDTKLDNTDSSSEDERQANADLDEPIPKNDAEKKPGSENLPSLIQIAAREDAKYLPDIVDEIEPSVVGISSTFEFTQSYNTWGWMGMAPEETTQQAVGTGTGIIMTEDGYIVTNAHVIYDDSEYKAGEAIEVSVLLNDESKHDAKIIAYDTETDLAVLKIDETKLTPAVFGDSSDLRVGELVIAVGNPLGFELFGTVTSGIVSALNRQISINDKEMTLIQTDAAINNGNSGGPLLNSCGQVIGINSAKLSSSYGSNQATIEGLGFAIPINEAKVIIDDLINYSYVTGRPQIGISTSDITEAYSSYLGMPMGVLVQSVQEDSAAEMAGMKKGDIIIDVEGTPIKTGQELNKVKNQYKAGDTITITVYRSGEDVELEVTLQEAHNVTGEGAKAENEKKSNQKNSEDNED
ncbi:MAG TPA: peptidase S1 [Ruminococcus sp.]|nr:trypsin-like peptidase domain-containing protein [Ruminococcus sp.]HBB19004.1 peptidase S1 [Ruminococcus sp.]